MSATNTSGSSLLLTMVKWSVENDLFLADFVQRCALPHLALVTKGQYLGVGAPNVASPNLKPYVLVHSTHKVRKVLARLLRIKEGKRKNLTEHKIAIPSSYSGYFEILSEDGRPVKCLETVQDLCRSFPDLCLVRQSCKAYLPDSDGELRSLYRSRNIHEGEVLTLVGQFNFKKIIFLRCFDENGNSVYLKLNQKGKFSPVARPDAITGVHSIENLMNKRLPLTVKLIQGSYPADLSKLAGGGPFVLQLESVFTEEVAFIHSLQKEKGQFHAVPLNGHIRLAAATNHPQVRNRSEFQKLCQQCDSSLLSYLDQMYAFNDHQLVFDNTVLDGSRSPDSLKPLDSAAAMEKNNRDESEIENSAPAVADEEIDQLYDYIRGLAPLPDSCHHPQGSNRAAGAGGKGDYKPPPPPVETIPSRKSVDSLSHPSPSGRDEDQLILSQSPSPERNSKELPSPTNSGLIAEKRLDDVIYGGSKMSGGKKPLSKSTEKLSHQHIGYGNRVNGYHHPQYRKNSEAEPQAVRKLSRRPLSMVIPDNTVLFPRLSHPSAFPGPEYFPPPGFYPPYHQQFPMYHSFMNLNMGEEEPPPAYSTNPSQFPHSPAPPPPYGGFPSVRPVYTRYAPRYQYQPVYRV